MNIGGGHPLPLLTNVEVSVRCENLRDEDFMSKSDPTCVLFSKDNKTNHWIEVGRTEKIPESLSPRWTKKFLLQYRFEERQMLRFSVYDIDSSRETRRPRSSGLGGVFPRRGDGGTEQRIL